MWEPWRLTTLWVFTACYRDTLPFFFYFPYEWGNTTPARSILQIVTRMHENTADINRMVYILVTETKMMVVRSDCGETDRYQEHFQRLQLMKVLSNKSSALQIQNSKLCGYTYRLTNPISQPLGFQIVRSNWHYGRRLEIPSLRLTIQSKHKVE
jgi:hypothetical protein